MMSRSSDNIWCEIKCPIQGIHNFRVLSIYMTFSCEISQKNFIF
jgi:hypothetical protein